MSRAVGIKGRGTEMCSVLGGRAEGIILPGFGQAWKKEDKKMLCACGQIDGTREEAGHPY